jgi:hypothetical protein
MADNSQHFQHGDQENENKQGDAERDSGAIG